MAEREVRSTYDYVFVWKREEKEKIIERGEKWAETILLLPSLTG